MRNKFDSNSKTARETRATKGMVIKMKRILSCLLLVCLLLAGCAGERGGTNVTSEDIGAKDLLSPLKAEQVALTGVERPYEGLMTVLGVMPWALL